MFKKKSLGQHFLYSQHYLDLIADSADIKKGEVVVEIGPGEGTLTSALLERGAKVIAVEKDSRLIPLLREKFAGKDIEIVEADALRLDLSSQIKKGSHYKLVGNIPYYITGALLKKFLSESTQPSLAVLLVQKEVAERIARDTKESILSLSIKAYGTPQYIKTVPAGAFFPPPAVDSAILKVEGISRKNFTDSAEEKVFFELVKAGFAQKRKLLVRNLEKVLGERSADVLERTEVPKNARAEHVGLMKWLAISRYTKGNDL